MCVFCFKQKTAYEMRSSDWSSDVCSSDHIRHQEPADVAGDPARRLGVERLVPATCSPLEGPGDEQVAVGRVVGIRHRRLRTGLVPPGVTDRKRVVKGKSGSVRVDLGGRRIIKKKNNTTPPQSKQTQ